MRLVDGPSLAAGRLEVYHEGVWGTVCIDKFDYPEGDVVCKQLGLGSRKASGQSYDKGYGVGPGPIWMDELECTGSEARLADFGFGGDDGQNTG